MQTADLESALEALRLDAAKKWGDGVAIQISDGPGPGGTRLYIVAVVEHLAERTKLWHSGGAWDSIARGLVRCHEEVKLRLAHTE